MSQSRSLIVLTQSRICKGLEGKPTPRTTIHLMITTLKIRMIPDDEVDSFMMQLVQSKIRWKSTRMNVFDFDKGVTHEEPKEQTEN